MFAKRSHSALVAQREPPHIHATLVRCPISPRRCPASRKGSPRAASPWQHSLGWASADLKYLIYSNDRKRSAPAWAAHKNALMVSWQSVRIVSFMAVFFVGFFLPWSAAVSPSSAVETCSSRLSTSWRCSFHCGWFAAEVPPHTPWRPLTMASTVASPAFNCDRIHCKFEYNIVCESTGGREVFRNSTFSVQFALQVDVVRDRRDGHKQTEFCGRSEWSHLLLATLQFKFLIYSLFLWRE